MSIAVTIRDETPGGGVADEWSLEFLNETITVRELIRQRVYQEVQDHNLVRQNGRAFRGLIQPTRNQQAQNDRKPGATVPLIDWNAQYERAIQAYEANQLLVLIDDCQAESLDQQFTVGPNTAVTFLRLTLLVGG